MTLHTAAPLTSSTATQRAAIAVHRFGLGAAALPAAALADAPAWLLAQVGPADPQLSDADQALPGASAGLRRYAEFVRQRRIERDRATQREGQPTSGAATLPMALPSPFDDVLRKSVQADHRARLVTAALTPRPFTERLAAFWANHFTVSAAKPTLRGLVGAFEREAIRPQIAGRFEDLLRAAVTHPSMLRYLDNEQSAGPQSALVVRLARRAERSAEGVIDPANATPRITGLNENLAREVLELHTLGASAAREGLYTQADVTSFAALLTGWRVPVAAYAGGAGEDRPATESPTRFDAAWHQPGEKHVLGRRYAEGEAALAQLLQDLARHPATTRFVCTKLARHFVADWPPEALVERMAEAWRGSDGDLPTVYAALIAAPEAWQLASAKLKSPEEWVVSSARLLGLGRSAFARQADGGCGLLGQRLQAAPSPAGWPDTADDWLGPEAVWKRVEWATRLAERVGSQVDARSLAQTSLGPLLTPATATQIARAADAPQALALLLLSPELQRR
ncbi:MAG: DUF1800 domain-containing protein [Burkholderiaceae bacterium]